MNSHNCNRKPQPGERLDRSSRSGTIVQAAFSRILCLCTLIALCGCASVDFDYPRTESRAVTDTSDSRLGKAFANVLQRHPDESGFFPIEDGVDALAFRLTLAEGADHSIDAQYFLIHDDPVGRLFVESLLRAADRGVRVRLLIDDIHTSGHDFDLAVVDSHPNIDVRIFNPLGNRTAKVLNVTNVRRVIRRMHNKSFTVDNQVTVIGGRNIGDEYFGASSEAAFGDLDVLAVGHFVQEVSSMFDSYWNHRAAVPILALTKGPSDPQTVVDEMRRQLTRAREENATGKYAKALRSSVFDILQRDTSSMIFAPHKLVFDSPDKSQPDAAGNAASIVTSLQDSIADVERELIVITPYLVLAKDDLDGFQALRDSGISVTVLTNSLASNNHTISHSGYKSVRKPLLRMGVRILEVRADPSTPGNEGLTTDAPKKTLHTKAYIVDRRRVFVGSFNWNQRSKNVDTEMGVIIESPELALAFAERIDNLSLEGVYEVNLNEKSQLRWTGLEDDRSVILTKEPQTTWWHRFSAGFLGILPIKSQL